MATVRDIVERALRKIDVTAHDEAATADEMASGVVAYNMMLHAWKLRQVDISHADQDAADTFPLGPEYEEGTVFLLASALSHEYSVPQSFDAQAWFKTIQAALRPRPTASIPGALLDLPSQRLDVLNARD